MVGWLWVAVGVNVIAAIIVSASDWLDDGFSVTALALNLLALAPFLAAVIAVSALVASLSAGWSPTARARARARRVTMPGSTVDLPG